MGQLWVLRNIERLDYTKRLRHIQRPRPTQELEHTAHAPVEVFLLRLHSHLQRPPVLLGQLIVVHHQHNLRPTTVRFHHDGLLFRSCPVEIDEIHSSLSGLSEVGQCLLLVLREAELLGQIPHEAESVASILFVCSFHHVLGEEPLLRSQLVVAEGGDNEVHRVPDEVNKAIVGQDAHNIHCRPTVSIAPNFLRKDLSVSFADTVMHLIQHLKGLASAIGVEGIDNLP
mmetsp:Transcript_6406/g.14011  ORF Transcript_6406/g.14011 Transcript_6406/m.14011 type:complete len:228 (-) Transcript_6406:636-1319(-)